MSLAQEMLGVSGPARDIVLVPCACVLSNVRRREQRVQLSLPGVPISVQLYTVAELLRSDKMECQKAVVRIMINILVIPLIDCKLFEVIR